MYILINMDIFLAKSNFVAAAIFKIFASSILSFEKKIQRIFFRKHLRKEILIDQKN